MARIANRAVPSAVLLFTAATALVCCMIAAATDDKADAYKKRAEAAANAADNFQGYVVEGEFLIGFDDSVGATRMGVETASLARSNPFVKSSRTVSSQAKIVHVTVNEGTNPAAVSRSLGALPGVAYVEPVFRYSPTRVQPNDKKYDKLWGLEAIEAPEAWESTTGSRDVIVCVIDTG